MPAGLAQVRLAAFLDEQKLDALLLLGDSLCNPNIYYLSGFWAGDSFALLAGGERTLLVSSMEKGRAILESSVGRVATTSDYGAMEKLKSMSPEEAYSAVLRDFLKEEGIRRLGVSAKFPVGIYSSLSKDFDISIIESPVPKWRAVKTPAEIEAITAVQRACERATTTAVDMIRKSSPVGDILYLEGKPLTSEWVRSEVEVSLVRDGCDAVDTIIAGGKDAANPHSCGSGPLAANAPIVLDIFPRSKTTRYFADMTRTVLRGEASTEVMEMYDAVLAAQEAGLSAIRAGASGKEVHARVSDIFDERGYRERDRKGFTHSTGHGVGIEVHEGPSLSIVGGRLEAGNVVTVEPGLYYPDIGGIRIEDLVVVTQEGCDNLTRFEKRLVI